MTHPMSVASVLITSLIATAACAGVISVPNGSFENPTVPDAVPWAGPDIGTWQKATMPGWWLGSGQTAADWNNLAGVFLNVGSVAGVDGSQAAFLFAVPGMSLSQELSETFTVGQSYHLTMAAEGGGYGMLLNVPVELRLYYRDALDQHIVLGAQPILNANPGDPITQLVGYQLDIPAVQTGDAWAGRPIGIEIASTVGFADMGGYWDIDNVRLTSVPEPALLGVLVPAAFVTLARKRRARA